MRTLATKAQVLEDAGYYFSFDRRMYLNRSARKGFSAEYVQDHGEARLEECIAKPAPRPEEWLFFFNQEPSDSVKRELSKLLGLTPIL
jgi:hypothetical protein